MDEIWVIARNCSTVTVSHRVAVRCRARSSPKLWPDLVQTRGDLWIPAWTAVDSAVRPTPRYDWKDEERRPSAGWV